MPRPRSIRNIQKKNRTIWNLNQDRLIHSELNSPRPIKSDSHAIRLPKIVLARLCDGCDCSLNGDLLGRSSSGLGHVDGKNAVLQAGLDIVLVDRSREGEDALERSDRALASPEPVSGLGFVVLRAFLFLWRLDVFVVAFSAALDNQSLGVGELNIDVLLRDARQFTIEVICPFTLTDVEARRERANCSLVAGRAVVIVVVQKTEEGGEVARAGEVGTENRHVVSWKLGDLKDVILY